MQQNYPKSRGTHSSGTPNNQQTFQIIFSHTQTLNSYAYTTRVLDTHSTFKAHRWRILVFSAAPEGAPTLPEKKKIVCVKDGTIRQMFNYLNAHLLILCACMSLSFLTHPVLLLDNLPYPHFVVGHFYLL